MLAGRCAHRAIELRCIRGQRRCAVLAGVVHAVLGALIHQLRKGPQLPVLIESAEAVTKQLLQLNQVRLLDPHQLGVSGGQRAHAIAEDACAPRQRRRGRTCPAGAQWLAAVRSAAQLERVGGVRVAVAVWVWVQRRATRVVRAAIVVHVRRAVVHVLVLLLAPRATAVHTCTVRLGLRRRLVAVVVLAVALLVGGRSTRVARSMVVLVLGWVHRRRAVLRARLVVRLLLVRLGDTQGHGHAAAAATATATATAAAARVHDAVIWVHAGGRHAPPARRDDAAAAAAAHAVHAPSAATGTSPSASLPSTGGAAAADDARDVHQRRADASATRWPDGRRHAENGAVDSRRGSYHLGGGRALRVQVARHLHARPRPHRRVGAKPLAPPRQGASERARRPDERQLPLRPMRPAKARARVPGSGWDRPAPPCCRTRDDGAPESCHGTARRAVMLIPVNRSRSSPGDGRLKDPTTPATA
mmetsp:Transcript_8227/g.21219  ORF Transcript_8227/g.21219 Transcript_8227/m.21219 type:complete len:473 (-) Transcript_8227:233-1651(-)